MYVSITFLTYFVSVFIGQKHLICEALYLNQNYEPVSNMPPKSASRFTSIPTSTGGWERRQGRGSGREAGSDEDDRDSIPLV